MKRFDAVRGAARASTRRASGEAASAVLLFALVISGCASVDRAGSTSQADIVVLATDRETAHELLLRLNGVENLPAPQAGEAAWSQGHLTGVRAGNVYTIAIGQLGGWDDTTKETIMRKAIEIWRPRYILLLGTALAVAHDSPLGAVGAVTLTCDFDLGRYLEFRDMGNCYRPDGGLLAAALSVADQWEAAADTRTGRAGCSPARLTKLAALSGNADPGPRYVEIATSISEEIHRGLIMETEGIIVAKAAEELRHEKREPIGFLMIRGVSEIRHPRTGPEADGEAEESEARLLLQACAARDTADFAVELIRHRWPVSPRVRR